MIVNEKLSVSSGIKKELNNAIYFIGKYGLSNHMNFISCDKLFYRDHLYGLAYFVKMVEEERGCKYIELLDNLNWS